MTSPLRSVPAPGLVMTGIVSVQLGAGIAKTLFDSLPPSSVVFLRLLTSLVVLGFVTSAAIRTVLVSARRADLVVVAGFGLALAAMNLAFYEAISRIPLGAAVTIEFLGPLGVAVATSRRRLDLAWVVLAGLGVVLLARGGSAGLDLVGVAFAMLAAAGWATYILLSAQTGRRMPGATGLALASAVGTIVVAPVGLYTGGADLWQPDLLLLGVSIGLLSSVVPYSLELEALRRMPATVFGILMSLEPAVAALVGLVVLDEVLHAREWAAIGLVVLACLGVTRARPRSPHR